MEYLPSAFFNLFVLSFTQSIFNIWYLHLYILLQHLDYFCHVSVTICIPFKLFTIYNVPPSRVVKGNLDLFKFPVAVLQSSPLVRKSGQRLQPEESTAAGSDDRILRPIWVPPSSSSGLPGWQVMTQEESDTRTVNRKYMNCKYRTGTAGRPGCRWWLWGSACWTHTWTTRTGTVERGT